MARAPTTVAAYLELVGKSGLVAAEQLTLLEQQHHLSFEEGDSPQDLANRLVSDGLLTRFQAKQLLVGKHRGFTLGKYRVLEQLGVGGMGTVYLASHIGLSRRVAIKIFAPRGRNPAALERFFREARAAAALDHPNIVRAHDVDEEGKFRFLVMEYIDGSSLQHIVEEHGPLSVVRALSYVHQAAMGLQYAHERGLVHRDIKPGNLLLDRRGTVKISDMGLARFKDNHDNLTRFVDAGRVLGTADYISPEQALDCHAADIRSDIYSLGFTGYFLLTGKNPFGDGTATQKLIWHQTRPPRPIRELRPELPEEVATILLKMMDKDPAQRYQTPKEVVDALAPWVPATLPPPPEAEMPQLCQAALRGVKPESHQFPTLVSRAAKTTVVPRVNNSAPKTQPIPAAAPKKTPTGRPPVALRLPPPEPVKRKERLAPRTLRIIAVTLIAAVLILGIAGYFLLSAVQAITRATGDAGTPRKQVECVRGFPSGLAPMAVAALDQRLA